MSISKSEILELWVASHGELSPKWRSAFLADPRVARLSRIEAGPVRNAIRVDRKLDAILESALAVRSQRSQSKGARSASKGRSRSRFSHGHYPHRPADTDLHKKIGPTQNYGDDT